MISESETDTPELTAEALQDILIHAAERAVAGVLTDSERSDLYRLALTVAAEEFYRIEQRAGGIVTPEVLILLQQISLLCEPNIDIESLIGPVQAAAEAAREHDPDSGESEQAVG